MKHPQDRAERKRLAEAKALANPLFRQRKINAKKRQKLTELKDQETQDVLGYYRDYDLHAEYFSGDEEFLNRYKVIPSDREVEEIVIGPIPELGIEWLLCWGNKEVPVKIKLKEEVTFIKYDGESS